MRALGQSLVIDNRGGAGGNIAADLMFASLSSAIPFIKGGRLKAFGVTGAQRSPSIPELPTI